MQEFKKGQNKNCPKKKLKKIKKMEYFLSIL
jgi:hypothetical protein